MPILKPPRGSIIDYSNPISRGLVGCWIMNEGTGSKVYDLSGNHYDGTLTDMEEVDWRPEGLYFGGWTSNDHAITPYYPDLRDPFTLLYNIKYSSTGDNQLIGSHDGSNRCYLGIYVDKFSYGAGDSFDNTTITHGFSVGEWHQLCLKCSGTIAALCVDGVLRGFFSYTSSGASTLPLWLGDRNYSASRANVTGTIGYAYIYDHYVRESNENSLYFDPYQIIKQPDYHKNTTYFLPFPIGVHPFSSLLTHGGMQDFTGGINA